MNSTPDEKLITRIRPLLEQREGFSEKRMFGGVCFMIHGNMCVGTWQGSLVARLAKADHDDIQREPHTGVFDITGRVMKGWALVAPAGIKRQRDLKSWIDRAADFAASLPPKDKPRS